VGELAIEVASGLAVGLGMGLVGAGGAIFSVPVFGTLLDHGAKDAVVEALAVTGLIAAVSGLVAGARGLVDWRRVLTYGAAGIVGSQLAAPVAVRTAASVQSGLFTVVAIYAAWRMWSGANGTPDALNEARARSAWTPVAIGLVIGMLTSLLGVGGGFLLIPALATLEGLPMTRAVATSLMVIAINSAAGVAGLWLNGGLDGGGFHGRAVAIVVGCGLVGSAVGASIQRRVPQAALRRVFAVLLLLVTGGMVVRQVLG
jgi:uncharacterized membrane protein YfcA